MEVALINEVIGSDNAFISGLTFTVRSPELWIPIAFRKSAAVDWGDGKYAALAEIPPIA